MGEQLRKEFEKVCKGFPKITDYRGRTVFRDTKNEIKNSDSAIKKYLEADEKRFGNPKEIHQAAYIYLAIAFKLLEDKEIKVIVDEKPLNAEHMFHFAGHAFREIGQLNRAADAYCRSGALSCIKDPSPPLAVRSCARAKVAFAEIGEIDKSDQMHQLEWELRYKSSKNLMKRLLIGLWKVTSLYGTSASRWLCSLIVFIVSFSIGYELLHAWNLIVQKEPWTVGVTGFYYTLVTTSTLGYGDFVPSNYCSQIVVIMNIIFGYALLGVGLTILGRKTLRR